MSARVPKRSKLWKCHLGGRHKSGGGDVERYIRERARRENADFHATLVLLIFLIGGWRENQVPTTHTHNIIMHTPQRIGDRIVFFSVCISGWATAAAAAVGSCTRRQRVFKSVNATERMCVDCAERAQALSTGDTTRHTHTHIHVHS